MGYEVLLYVPNVIGYIRLLLMISAFSCYSSNAILFSVLFLINLILDHVDGVSARKLNQTSAFGAWFDVVLDCFGRGFLWSHLYEWGYVVAALEWCVFACTHSQMGAEWKSSFAKAPYLAEKVMEKNFKTPLGVFAIGSLQILPLWLYAYHTKLLSQTLQMPRIMQYAGIAFFSVGRAICFYVELYCLWAHIKFLLQDLASHNQQTKVKTK